MNFNGFYQLLVQLLVRLSAFRCIPKHFNAFSKARLRGSMEQSLKEELEGFVMEELRVRKLQELDILQKEERRDINSKYIITIL